MFNQKASLYFYVDIAQKVYKNYKIVMNSTILIALFITLLMNKVSFFCRNKFVVNDKFYLYYFFLNKLELPNTLQQGAKRS